MPGEKTWPTQPFPTNPPPFAKQELTVEDVNPYLPPDEYERLKERVLKANNKGLFTPINHTETVHIPGANGGALFGGTAAEPRTGAVYVITQDNPGLLRLLRPGESRGGGPPPMPGQAVYVQHCQVCHAAKIAWDGRGHTARFMRTPIRSTTSRLAQPRFDAAAIQRGVADREEPHARLPAPQRRVMWISWFSI